MDENVRFHCVEGKRPIRWCQGCAPGDGPVLLKLTSSASLSAAYRVWVGDTYSGAVIQVNPTGTDAVLTRTPLPGVTRVAASGTQVWATTASPSQLVELDPRTGTKTERPLATPAGASGLALGFSSIWVTTAHAVVRIQT